MCAPTSDIDKISDSSESLCTAGVVENRGTASWTKHRDAGSCGGNAPHGMATMMQVENVAVSWAPRDGAFRLKFHCGTNTSGSYISEVPCEGDPAYVGRGAMFEATDDAIAAAECACWIEEPTVLVIDPRPEYLENMYHATEELLSIFQTAAVAGRSLSAGNTRVVFAYGKICPKDAFHCTRLQTPLTLQLAGQLDSADDEVPTIDMPHVRPQILALVSCRKCPPPPCRGHGPIESCLCVTPL